MFDLIKNNIDILELVLSLFSILIALVSLIYTYKISGKISVVATEKIGESIDKYLSMKLPYTITLVREASNEKYEVKTLRDFLYAKDNGYYSNTTIDIREESYLDSMITVLNLLENARNNFFKPTKAKFIDLIQILPVKLLDFLPPEESSELKGKNIKELLKKKIVQIHTDLSGCISIELFTDSHECKSCTHQTIGSNFLQLCRADFNGDGKEEILFTVHCFSGRSLNSIDTYCLGYRSFLGIWKKWRLIDINKIHIEHYSNIFPSEWQK